MTKLKEIYRCEICGNIVEVLHTGQGELVCCEFPMLLQKEKQNDPGLEKHVPILSRKNDTELIVKVGENEHPMQENHFIEWIEIIFKDNESLRVFLSPGDESMIKISSNTKKIYKIREYCNLHGLWVNNLE